jgi:hypothetical protein
VVGPPPLPPTPADDPDLFSPANPVEAAEAADADRTAAGWPEARSGSWFVSISTPCFATPWWRRTVHPELAVALRWRAWQEANGRAPFWYITRVLRGLYTKKGSGGP